MIESNQNDEPDDDPWYVPYSVKCLVTTITT